MGALGYTLGTMAVLGAGVGAATGMFSGNAAPGAAMGATVGVGMVGAGMGLGYAAKALAGPVARGGLTVLRGIGSGALNVSAGVGDALFSLPGRAVSGAAFGLKMAESSKGLDILSKMVKGAVSFTPGAEGIASGKFNFTNLGKGMMLAGGLAYAIGDTKQVLEKSRMGTMQEGIVTATPQPELNRKPSYADDGAASGDLVFALNRLRNG